VKFVGREEDLGARLAGELEDGGVGGLRGNVEVDGCGRGDGGEEEGGEAEKLRAES
jgi:hypothetical protein